MSGDWEPVYVLSVPVYVQFVLKTAGNRLVLPLSSLRLGVWSLFSVSLSKVTQKYSSVYERKKRNGHSKTYENRGGRNGSGFLEALEDE